MLKQTTPPKITLLIICLCGLGLFIGLRWAKTAVAAPIAASHQATPITNSEFGGSPPIATNDVYTTTEDVPLSISAPGVLTNDTDPDGDVLGVAISALPSHGMMQLNSDGSFIYTPTANYNGADTFTYLAYDGLPLPTIAYWPFDDQTDPTADASGNGHDGDLINGPVFSTDVPITYTSSTASLQFDGVDDRVDAAGSIPLANNSFTVAFWAKRSSLSGNSDFAVGLGTNTTANNYLHIGFRNTNIFTCAFWNNDLNTAIAYTDLDWHHWACTYDADTNFRAIYRDGVMVASGTATADFQGTGTLTLGSRGANDYFAGMLDEVRIYDLSLPASEIASMMTTAPGTGGGDTASVTLNITLVNDAPIAVDDTYTTTQETPLNITLLEGDLTTLFASNNSNSGNMFDVTAGLTDVTITSFDANIDAGAETVEVYYKVGSYVGSQQVPGNWTLLGTANVVGQGINIPTPVPIGGLTIPAGQTYGLYFTLSTGTQINYTDGANVYTNGDLTITTGTGNAYPFGNVNTPRTWNGTIYYEINPGVLSNDSDVDNPDLTAVLDTNPSHGALSLNGNGTFVYTPTVNYCGLDTFTYFANDDITNSNFATANISIACGPNDPPVASNDTYTTTEDIPLTITSPGLLSNDTDPNGDEMSATLLTAPTNGSVSLNSDGSFTYTPDANFNGVDTFTYLTADSLPAVQGFWPFEDGSNPTADESDQNQPGTLVNGPTFVSSTPVTLTNSTQALSFDGVDDRVDITGLSLANESFTVAFWAKRASLSGNSDFTIGLGTSTTTNNYLHIGFRNTNIFTCAFWNNDLNTAVTYTDLNWHHWACTYNATTNSRAIYLDGIMVASDTATADFQGTGTLTLGSRGTSDNFSGSLDDVRIYSSALSAAEVQEGMLGYVPGLLDTATVTLTVTLVNDPPVAVDDAYTTSQGTPINTNANPNSLTTLFAQNNGNSGNMFDVTAGLIDITITSFDASMDAGAETVEVYYKVGSYVGSQQVPGDWTLLGTANVVGLGNNIPTPVPIGGLTIPAGQTYGIYFTLSTGAQINYSGGANVYTNDDLTITTGTGNVYPFGTVNSPRTWNGTIYYTGGGVLSNDVDIEESLLTASLSTSPGNGTLTFNPNGSFIYTPTVSFVGVDTFDYIASDGALTNTATVSITVTTVPCLVETTGDSLTDYASADESALQTAVNNANPGDTLKVAGTCAGTHLQGGETQTVYISQILTLQGGYTSTNWLAAPDPVTNPTILDALEGGRVAYVPLGVQVTLDSLTLQGASSAGDGGGIYSQGTLTVSNSLLTENIAINGSGIYNNGTLTIDTVTFTGNESTNNGTIANFGSVSVQNSTFYSNTVVRGGGIYSDIATELFVTNSTFADNVAGEGGGIHSRGVMTVTNSTFAYNTADFGNAIHNWGGTMALYNNILANNAGITGECFNQGTLNASVQNLIDDGTCGASLTDDPLLAPLADNGGTTWTFMLQSFSPAIDAGDNATCEATDQRGVTRPIDALCDIGAVELDDNYVSVATADFYTTTEDIPLTVAATGVLANDVDGDWDGLTAVLDTAVTTGTLALNGDGSFTYTPAENFCGSDGFTYHANDGQADSNVVSVILTVACVNDIPTATDDAYVTTEDTPLSVTTPGVLGNDEDGDGDGLTAVLDTTVTTGTLTLNSDGSFNYTPPANWFGTTSFTYQANDGQNNSNTAVVTLTVLSENDLPVVDAGKDETADEGEVITFSGSYSDPGLHDSVASLGNLMGGISVHWDFGDGATATGTLTPTHSYADNGTFTVTLTITDTEGGVNSDSLLVTVNNVAPALESLPDQTATAGTIVSFTVAFTDTGVLDTHTAVIDWGDGTTEQGVVNQAAMTASGSHSYATPGSYTVTVTLTDDDGESNNQTFIVTVTASGYQLFLPVIVN